MPNENTIDDMSDEPADDPTGDPEVEQFDDAADGARQPNRQARMAAWAVIALFLGDILIGPKKGDALVVWGGPWTANRDVSAAETSTLPGGNQSTGFATADLYSDGLLDIVRIAYRDSSQDLLIEHVRPREFEVQALPSSSGKSLAAEIATSMATERWTSGSHGTWAGMQAPTRCTRETAMASGRTSHPGSG